MTFNELRYYLSTIPKIKYKFYLDTTVGVNLLIIMFDKHNRKISKVIDFIKENGVDGYKIKFCKEIK